MEVRVKKLKSKMVEMGITQDTLSVKMGIARSTLNRKLQKGGEGFLIGEVQKISDILELTDQEAAEIFLNRKSHF